MAPFGRAFLVLATVLLAACDQPQASSSSPPAATPTVGPSTLAVASAEPTAIPTPQPDPTEIPCPTAPVLTVREYVEAPRTCFRGVEVRIRGWLDTIEGLHGTGAGIKPFWLAYPQIGRTCDEREPHCFYAATLWQHAPPDVSPCSEEEPHCAIVFPHIRPDSSLTFEPLQRWLILTGHTNDPAAEGCRWWYGDEREGDLDDAEAVRHCRKQFVVTAIEEVE